MLIYLFIFPHTPRVSFLKMQEQTYYQKINGFHRFFQKFGEISRFFITFKNLSHYFPITLLEVCPDSVGVYHPALSS